MIQKLEQAGVLCELITRIPSCSSMLTHQLFSNFLGKKMDTLKSKYPAIKFDVKLLKGHKHPHIDGVYGTESVF